MTRTGSELLHGTLELLVLRILESGPANGYAIGRRIEELTDDALRVDEGSLYPALYRMQRRGWLSASWRETENRRRAKFYRLTGSGRRKLRSARESWVEFESAVRKILEGA